jgi:type I restriction enzyme S subunit
MDSEWRNTTWGELATLEYGGLSKQDYSDSGSYRAYGTNGPVGWTEKVEVGGPGVIVGRKGAYRGVHFSPGAFGVIGTAFYLRPKVELDIKWAYYRLLTLDLNGMDSGSAIPSTSRHDFYRVKVAVPPIQTQRAIASVLGALDDKIELNGKMSRTLDETAQTIFKSMFPGIGETSDRSSIAAAKLESLVTMTKGRSYKSTELAASDTALVTLKSFLRFGGYRTDGLKGYTGSYKPEQVIEPGEIVVALTDVTQAADVIGNPATVLPDTAYSVLVASLDTAVVRPTQGVPKSFVYFLMRTSSFKQHARAHTTGTTVLHLNPKHLLTYSVGDVDLDEASSFDAAVSPMLDRLRLCAAESVTLKRLRDTLLPKLLSGELQVRDAEAIVEEAV